MIKGVFMRLYSFKIVILSLYLVSAFINIGCDADISKKKNKTEPHEHATPPEVKPSSTDVPVYNSDNNSANPNHTPMPEINPSLNIVELEKPFRYEAEMNWSKNLKNVTLFLNSTLLFKSTANDINNFSFGLSHNTDYKIQLYINKEGTLNSTLKDLDDDNNRTLIKEWNITTPLDIELSTAFLSTLPNPSTLFPHRLFIQKTIPVITNGLNLSIQSNELYSNGGVIETFAENQKAPPDTAGRSGGTLIIKTNKAIGDLTIYMRGENGGDGSVGSTISTRAATGDKGLDGTWSYGGEHNEERICGNYPDSGDKGHPGGRGNKGGNGKHGGDSGIFNLEISEKQSSINEKVYNSFGFAGKHGHGGPGQSGGDGGPRGNAADGCSVGPAKKGPEGDPGKEGPWGDVEPDGKNQQECISKGEGFGRCTH